MNERRKLIWKYFWKRKREEVSDFFREHILILWILQLGILFFTGAFLTLSTLASREVINLELGNLLIFIGIIEVTIVILYVLVSLLVKWLRSNWRLATMDAIEELNWSRQSRPPFKDERRKRKR